MIAEIYDLLEQLNWEPVEDSTADVSFRVAYMGMTPAEGYAPEVRELYDVQLWVEEQRSIEDTQIAVQVACRLAFIHVSELLNANIVTSTVREVVEDEDSDEPTARLIFETVSPSRSWE